MNIQKPFLAILLPVFVTPFAATASPLVSIGDGIDVFFNGTTSARWESNLFRNNSDETDDLYFTLSPGFDVNFGRGASSADFTISTRYDVLRYMEESSLDAELFNISGNGSYRTARWNVSGQAGFAQAQSNTADSNVEDDLIESETLSARLNGEYRMSPKFSVSSGFSLSSKEYKTFEENFADRTVIEIPLDIYYELTPKVDLSIGYRYSGSDIDSTKPDSSGSFRDDYTADSHFFNVGARGMLLPKVTGSFKVGYILRDSYDRSFNAALPGGGFATSTQEVDSSGRLGLDASFNWATTPKFTTILRLGSNFGVAGDGNTTENTSVSVAGNYSISQHFSASGNLGLTMRDYDNAQSREDENYDLGARLTYRPNQYWSFSTGYTYSQNESNFDDADYENNILYISGTLRY